MHRTGRILLVLAVVFFLAVSSAMAGRGDEACCRSGAVSMLVKTPVMVLKDIVVAEAAFSEHARGVALNLGMVFMKGILLRLPRRAAAPTVD
jgi:hypothetical protein